MTAEETLEATLYHIYRLDKTDGEKEFSYELNAILPLLRSIPEHLLEDYNQKYNLEIKDTGILLHMFESEAKKQRNSRAINYYAWWDNEFRKIKSTPEFITLFNKRHISIHRRIVDKDLIKASISNGVTLSDEVTIRLIKDGKIVYEQTTKSPPSKQQHSPEVKIEWFFSDHPTQSINQLCLASYQMMLAFVQNSRKLFP